MELGLSLGNKVDNHTNNNTKNDKNGGGFCMGLETSTAQIRLRDHHQHQDQVEDDHDHDHDDNDKIVVGGSSSSSEDPSPPPPPPPLQLHLLPFSPLPVARPPLRFPWLSHNRVSSEPGSSDGLGPNGRRGVEEAEEQSSPNSGTSSFMEFSLYTNTNKLGGGGCENNGKLTTTLPRGGSDHDHEHDDDENGLVSSSSTRKKLRLSKEQSTFLEESFKEHHTLNPKQKLALAKQLNLRPRQVEVWFQNRRARTKLKQTEVDCEYLKRCCETLTEENRRLQKELQELRALKSSQPFFMHLPPTTLTMCPACERVAPTSTTPSSSALATVPGSSSTTLSLGNKPKPVLPPFSNNNAQAHRATS